MRGVLLAAPDRQRGTRQHDGENGSEQYDSSHSDSLIVATVADAQRRFEHTPAPEGVQSARENESDRRDHRGQGRAAHDAEEERLGRVDDERDGQRRATLDLASWLGLGLGLGLWLGSARLGSTSASRGGCGIGAGAGSTAEESSSGSSVGRSVSACARSSGQTSASSGEISWATATPMPLVSAFRCTHLSVPKRPQTRNARFLLPQKTGAADAGGK